MRYIVVLIAVLATSACTSLLLGNTSSREPVASGNRTSTPTAADSAISGAIRQAYSSDDEISSYAIGIRTNLGNVTLSGTVASYPVRDRAVRIARETDGVRKVDSRIIVNTNL